MMTPVELRFADDGSYLAKVETGWIKGRYANDQPVGWFTRLKELIEGGIR
jgi:hypothetical protein